MGRESLTSPGDLEQKWHTTHPDGFQNCRDKERFVPNSLQTERLHLGEWDDAHSLKLDDRFVTDVA